VIGLDEIRSLAMALPQVEEGPPVRAARRIASFKVAGKSFIGVELGGRSMTVSLPEREARAFAAKDAKAFEEIWRNREIFMGLRVDLSAVSADQVRELIESSWRHCAQKRKAAKSGG
jgi:predicted DNA-binding protein (MmcQ/YjbR family)